MKKPKRRIVRHKVDMGKFKAYYEDLEFKKYAVG